MSAADLESEGKAPKSTEAPPLPGEGGGAPPAPPVVKGKGERFPAGRYRVIVKAKNAGFKQRVYLQGPSKGGGYLKGEAGKSRVVVAHKDWHLAIQE